MPHMPLSDAFPRQAISNASQISGYLSLCIWFFAQLPQIIENHMNQSVDGVSVLFLLSWISGDVTNLLGCLLTGALPFQILIATYYCFIDVILTFQYWYYTHIFPYHTVPHNLLQSPNMLRPRTPKLGRKNTKKSDRTNRFEATNSQDIRRSPMALNRPQKNSLAKRFLTAAVMSKNVTQVSARPVACSGDDTGSWLERHERLQKFLTASMQLLAAYNKETVGKIAAWTSSCLYLSSRTPQIIANYNNKSTHGISPYLFLFAMLGNTFYVVSVVLELWMWYHDQDPHRHQHFWDQLPFLIGSGGTIVFDWVILFQFWYYGQGAHHNSHTLSPLHTGSKSQQTTNQVSGFQKPDWYTNNHLASIDDEDIFQQNRRAPKNTFERHNLNETSSLLSYNDMISSPPPPHYISASLSRSNSHTVHNNVTSSILKSLNPFSQPESFKNTRSPSQSSLASGYANSNLSPTLKTSLIPSIINSVSSVNKKLSQDSKVPFMPADFLNDEFHHPAGNSAYS